MPVDSPRCDIPTTRIFESGGYFILSPLIAPIVEGLGIQRPEELLDLPGEVITGHRDRQVLLAHLGRYRIILKREHRVPWSVRWRSWRDGFGSISLCEREAATLALLQDTGVSVPQVLALGTDCRGRAFLILRRIPGVRDLRRLLHDGFLDTESRWELARAVGTELAHVHKAGVTAPNLSAKHVLVRPDCRTVVLIDWANSMPCKTLGGEQCLTSLAALHASVAVECASVRERLLALRAYMRTLGFRGPVAPLARAVLRLTAQVDHRRFIQEQRQSRRIGGAQRLRWVDGERLCVCRPLWQACDGRPPDWLMSASRSFTPFQLVTDATISKLGNCRLLQLPPASRWKQWLARACRKPVPRNAIMQAGLEFRLRRYGIATCPVLAFGVRDDGSGFLLAKMPSEFTSLSEWLRSRDAQRSAMLRRIGRLLRRCHEAGCRRLCAGSVIVEPRQSGFRLRVVADGGLIAQSGMTHRQRSTELQNIVGQLGLVDADGIAQISSGYHHITGVVTTTRGAA